MCLYKYNDVGQKCQINTYKKIDWTIKVIFVIIYYAGRAYTNMFQGVNE